MKTKIIYSHKIEEGFTLSHVIPINKDTCVLMKHDFPDVTVLELIGAINKKIIISVIDGMDNGWHDAWTLFKSKTWFSK